MICGDCFSDANGENQNQIPADSVVIPAPGHSWSDWDTSIPASCTTDGEEKRTCANCDAFETRPLPAPGHSWNAWSSNNDGTHTRSCSACEETQTENCAYDAVVTPPTCTEPGYTTYTCTTCGYSYQGNTTNPSGHSWNAWSSNNDGTHTRSCSACEETQTENCAYDAVVTPPTCTEQGYTLHQCACGDSYKDNYTDALGHAWDEGTVVVEPKHLTPGEKTCTCTRCGIQETVEIPRLGNPFEDVHDEDFFFNPVMWALDETVTGGIDDTHFAPGKTVMRSDAMMFFWAANKRPEPTITKSPFKDVGKKHWAFKPIMWGVENGVTGGTGPKTFSPDKTCSRSEILQFLYAAMGKPEYHISNPYSDLKPRQWYYDGAIWAYENGLEKGENGKFKAKTPCTRGYVVTYLYRFFTHNELAE